MHRMEVAMSQNIKKSVRITASVPSDAHRELEQVAEEKRVSVAWVVRAAIDQYLNQDSQKKHELKTK